jgi:hypothetical protein
MEKWMEIWENIILEINIVQKRGSEINKNNMTQKSTLEFIKRR